MRLRQAAGIACCWRVTLALELPLAERSCAAACLKMLRGGRLLGHKSTALSAEVAMRARFRTLDGHECTVSGIRWCVRQKMLAGGHTERATCQESPRCHNRCAREVGRLRRDDVHSHGRKAILSCLCRGWLGSSGRRLPISRACRGLIPLPSGPWHAALSRRPKPVDFGLLAFEVAGIRGVDRLAMGRAKNVGTLTALVVTERMFWAQRVT